MEERQDLISRKAAIDAVCMDWCNVKHQNCEHPFVDENDDYYWCDGCETALRTLPDLPSAQPERKWIPCIERLPEKHGEMYLVTISDGSVYSFALQWDINRKRWYFSFLNNGEILIDYVDDVIAWMPLPEPYRGEGDE